MAATVRRCRRRLVNLARAPTRHASGSTQRLLSCGAFGAQLPPASSATSSSSRAFSSAAARAFFKLNDLAKIAGDIRPLGSSGSESITQYQDTRTLRYTSQELYAIVADVNSYSEFLPLCTSSKVLGPAPMEICDTALDNKDATRRVHAELGVGFRSFKESYKSLVEMKQNEWVKATALPHPLFKHLSSRWNFVPLSATFSSSKTRIDFQLQYCFSSPLYTAVASGIFKDLSSKMMHSFEERAVQVYGSRA